MSAHRVSLLLFALPALIFGQSNGSIRGQVTDPSAAVVPGATVVITGTNGSRTAKSDGSGRYTLPNVPAGKYSVRADAPGFVTFTSPEVTVNSGQAAPLDIALQIATEAAEVSVTDQTQAALSVDASSNVGALVLKDADLDALPDDPDDLQADLEALAGPAAGPNGAQFFVDGFSGGQLPPKSSIREIRINSNPFSSEFDAPGFGRVEILTRPGTDKYHGQVFFNYGNRDFDSRNPFLNGNAPSYDSKLFTANLGGPINKKSSFFIDFQKRDITQNALINAEILNSNFTQQIGLSEAVITPNHLWQISPRIDYAINQNNTLIMRYSHSDNSQVGGVGAFNLPTQTTQTYNKNNTVQITETAVLGTKAVDETSFQFRDLHSNQTAVGDTNAVGLNVTSSFNSGGAPFTQGTNYTDTTGYELRNFVTLAQGKHAIKIGFRVRQSDEDSRVTQNFNGSYTFSTPTNTAVPQCLTGTGISATSLGIYQQTEIMLSQGIPIATILAQGCGPTQFTLSGGIPFQQVRQFDLGAYVQDDWRLRPNLTVNVGLRYETQNNIHDHLDFAPRVGFAWAPRSKANQGAKTVVRGGYGIFYTRFDEGNTLNTLRYNGVDQTNYIISATAPNAAAALDYFALTSGASPALPPSSLLTVENQAVYQTASNLRAPYMMQSAIGVDRQLPWRTQMSVNFIDTRGVHVLRLRDINAPELNGVRPYAGGDIYQYETSGLFKQSQIIANVNSRINSHFSLQGNYVLGWAHSNTNGTAGFPMDQYNDNQDWGRATFDVRNRGLITGNIGLPWKITASPFMTAASGMPFNITTGQPYNGDGILNERPSLATASTPAADIVRTRYGNFNINPAPGAAVIPFDYGDGPGQFSVNVRVSRTWGWGERVGAAPQRGGGGPPGGFGGGRGGPGGGGGFARGGGGGRGGGPGGTAGNNKRYNLTLTVSARNLFNHVNYGAPTGSLASPFFGESLGLANTGGGQFGGANGAAGNRKIEVQLRFTF